MKISAEAGVRWRVAPALFGLALVAGCGGGGGGADTASAAAAPSRNLSAIVPTANQPVAAARNVLPISVGRANKVNLPMASVTVCAPGSTSDCQTVDNLLVDTGSTGLRIVASVLSGIALPPQNDGGGNAVGECAHFADGFMWGAVRIADVRIGGEVANALPIHVVGDPDLPSIPRSCSNTGSAKDPVRSLGANGILGVSAFRHDCGPACEQFASAGIYYVCNAAVCVPTIRLLAEQVSNPVTKFAEDNNGVIVDLPAVPATGSARVDGSLLFGIGTQQNNALGGASVFAISPITGGVATFYKGDILDHSFIDTGSNALFFRDAAIPACGNTRGAGFYCGAAQQLSATIQGLNGTNASISFDVDNADELLSGDGVAFSNIAAPAFSALTFDWGLPFFFGRRVYLAIEGAIVPGASAGPFVAF